MTDAYNLHANGPKTGPAFLSFLVFGVGWGGGMLTFTWTCKTYCSYVEEAWGGMLTFNWTCKTCCGYLDLQTCCGSVEDGGFRGGCLQNIMWLRGGWRGVGGVGCYCSLGFANHVVVTKVIAHRGLSSDDHDALQSMAVALCVSE